MFGRRKCWHHRGDAMTTIPDDPLGDRMKEYEMMEAGRRALPGLPLLVRLDGKAFHTFTKGLERPFDARLQRVMDATTRHLVKECGARIGYTQSDEISLVYHHEGKAEPFLGGRFQKLTSILAATATFVFNRQLAAELPEKAERMALFDCRAWVVPSLEEAANTFLWRELDASKNSVAMAAQARLSHADLQGLSTKQQQELLFQRHGINWNDYPARCKRGAWFHRVEVVRGFTTDELDKLPPLHAARKDPDLKVVRHDVLPLEMPPFSRVKNRVGVLFHDEAPQVEGTAEA
jgi:tRNA(His) guanylyltransferase